MDLLIFRSIYLSIHPSIYLFIFVPIYLSTYPPIYLSIHPLIHPSIHPSIHLSDHLTYLFVPKLLTPADCNVTSAEDYHQKRQVRKLARPESSSKQGARKMDTPLFVSCRQKRLTHTRQDQTTSVRQRC